MTADQNKEISYIAYNHANMPTHVQMNNGEVWFTYDALGNKWYKRVGDYQRDEKHGTAYIFGMQYEFKYNNHIQYDWKLMFIGTDEGYVSAVYPEGIDSGFKFQYVYNHTDHLGNIRQNITRENGNLTVLREHNYYPFGLLHRGYNEDKEDLKYDKERDFIFTVQAQAGRYKYKFQGQERQEDLNLGWDSFKYRNYDYAIGRFFNVDPLAEKFPYYSEYVFSGNRVTDAVELEGKEPDEIKYQVFEANRNAPKIGATYNQYLNIPQYNINLNLSARTKLFINGSTNVIFGGTMAVGGAIYIGATDGGGAAVGGTYLVFTGSSMFAMGMTQLVEAFNYNNRKPDAVIMNYSTMYGAWADAGGLDCAKKIDNGAIILSMIAGGGIRKVFDISNPISRINTIGNIYSAASMIAPNQNNVSNSNNTSQINSYTIQNGDTLSQIAADHNTTVDALMEANPQIQDPDKIRAGDTLTLPSSNQSDNNQNDNNQNQ